MINGIVFYSIVLLKMHIVFLHCIFGATTPLWSEKNVLGEREGLLSVKPECLTAFKKDMAKRHSTTAKQNNKLFFETRSCRNGLALPKRNPLCQSNTLPDPAPQFWFPSPLSGFRVVYFCGDF